MSFLHSEKYNHQLECEPDRFDNDELVRRYQAGEFLYHTEKEDAQRILRQRAKHQKIMAGFDRVIDLLRSA
jgi:hypothetical protein